VVNVRAKERIDTSAAGKGCSLDFRVAMDWAVLMQTNWKASIVWLLL
jgi:hypothetical protein